MKTSLRKTLTVLSLVACTAFSVALAQAETGDTSSDTSASSDMSGTAGDTTMQPSAPTQEEGQAPQAMGEEYWKTAKSCTVDGKTYKRGDKGFSKCVDKMKEKTAEEMGGQKPSDMDTGSMDTGSMDSGSYGEESSSS